MQTRKEIDELTRALLRYDKKAIRIMAEEYASRCSFPAFVQEVLMPAMKDIGESWVSGDAALSQIYLCGKVAEELFDDYLVKHSPEYDDSPKLGILTLEDHHALGKRLVSAEVRANGYLLHDLGAGIGYREAADMVVREEIEILLVSVLMYPSAIKVEKLKNELTKMGCPTRLIVGGAPFNMDSSLWSRVGADAMGESANAGVVILRNWIEEAKCS